MHSLSDGSIDKRYGILVKKIRNELKHHLEQAKHFVVLARLRAYWNIGKHIADSFLDEDFRAAYGTSLYGRLGEHLDFKERVLHHMVQFYRRYPDFPEQTPLTWTHYRYLINVPDDARRLKIEQEIIRQGISSSRVKEFIPKQNAAISHRIKLVHGHLPVERGMPYLYAIRKGTGLNGEAFAPRLDLGFKMAINSENADYIRFVNARLVVSYKEKNGYRLETCQGETQRLYTYGAAIDRVVDGDTLVARVDLGFGLVTLQRLRLRAIDAPELKTAAGRKAKGFLIDLLKGVPRVVVKTYKNPGMYGRYLTDLFILPGTDELKRIAGEGIFVNQKLLDDGFAGLYAGG